VKSTSSPVPDQRAPQPSSLTKSGARAGQTCGSCGSERLTSLAMTLTDGTPVTFLSCHNCEHRTWNHRGRALKFTDVLTRATKHKS
jgi:DNA-directed RNA polymerase subunit M/transcription elongation factor TFIIS